jgi:phosphonate transport system substrate-binding protein
MNRLRFGTYFAPGIMPVYKAVAEEIGRQLGIEIELVVETDYESRGRDIYEVCFVCSLPYVEFERRGVSPAGPIAAPVLEGGRQPGALHHPAGCRIEARTARAARSDPEDPSVVA